MMKITKASLLSVLAAAATTTFFAVESTADYIPNARIIGGEQVNSGEFPYFVEMGGCGGALIAPDVVLFAAHCEEWKDKQLSIGAYKARTLEGGAQERFCDTWLADPKYGEGDSEINNDFALCKLNSPVITDGFGVKLELNEAASVPAPGEEVITMGLGVTVEGIFDSRPRFVHDLTIEAISNSDCNQDFAYNGAVKDSMLCAGKFDGTKDTCQGDSGGPLVKRTRRDDGTIVDIHVGVVSWGAGCAHKNYPGVYARTSARSDWIKSAICDLGSVSPSCGYRDPTPAPGCDHELVIGVETDGYADETSMTLEDSGGNKILKRNYLINNYENSHTVCLQSDECYNWQLDDLYGDGLCTADGCGTYSLTLNGEDLASGEGDFGYSLQKKICTQTTVEDTDEPSASPSSSPSAATSAAPSATPSAATSAAPSATLTRFCMDSPDFRWKNDDEKTCSSWASPSDSAERNNKKRCRRKWNRGERIYNICKESCGRYANLGPCKDLYGTDKFLESAPVPEGRHNDPLLATGRIPPMDSSTKSIHESDETAVDNELAV
eukprot:CAMPEP_0201215616 /NCGR_PEP_ID=MMETSP0851-20130426/189068_1 /ASSEMBLY_ACC=CAM_ASM_000631 /TAXON_ID=183588 /ORGANISM="Pseudo-nitzschia fraudulenta, Strain WWA7" /LENGTH=550 /DNA_ID=CAMNT_0047505113 /DNA_START=3213 /DNA_END=4865 /DNA_ORIENTATION=+